MRAYNLETLIKHLTETVWHNSYEGHSIHSLENSIELFKHSAQYESNKGQVPAFVVQDEFGGAIERIIASKIISTITL